MPLSLDRPFTATMPRGARHADTGPAASLTPEVESSGEDAPNHGNSTVLQAIASLHAELRSLKMEIVDIIDTRINSQPPSGVN